MMSGPAGLVGMGPRMRELRILGGITQDQLADIIGTSKSRISKLENGDPVSFSMLERFAEAMPFRTEAVLLVCLKEVYPKLLDETTIRVARGLIEQTRS